ncbi:hypothetical protein BAE44_0023049 [Dichanthelium oligosanthes]|uniref:DUF6598 domain-containing protein n=1 Tax=Dichanthelium oligosanthes TaxID=888268 RepID=A0A1E5USP6_9POAL|nr:hypothetical protein BAE44_0023049 [Dichanthelium oligosanthes]
MQVFSLRLSRTAAYPVKIYGTFAVRDCWEPFRNYVFNRTRDDPATILPIKEEGEMSAYKQLFRGYLESDEGLSGSKSKVYGRIPSDCYGLDMCYGFLSDGIETTIEVFLDAKHSSDVKMSAFTGGFDDEVCMVAHFVILR